MALDETEKIWFNGELIDWKDAQIHVLSHVVHYGSSVFEGLRCYDTENGPAVFRLKDHMKRLKDSAKVYRMDIPYTIEQLCEGVKDTININKIKSCYVRPIAFRGYNELGVYPLNCPVETVIAVWAWGQYLGEDALEQGIDICTSTWRKMAPDTMPNMAKAGSNYMNSQLSKMEATMNGYKESVLLNYSGNVAEGSGENIFLIEDGKIYTPDLGSSVLRGITRDTVITIAEDLGYEVSQEIISRERLYLADEVFFTGSAAELSPIRSIDQIQIGKGKRGPITKKLQDALFDIINNRVEDEHGWLDFI
ncbi:branched-chain amino acid transaminase [Methanosphaera cuniculi]|uniref:Branched-chain-amino-acid aminotransferase n=1 Tax=Methanosphaera cuniculi TaxID=1077256 RepID=A0A2A2HEZ4_9EURY|nr:branched-chain amino acid transaminase [Methanosphaera cuniculi]PAV07967.1 branched chain amino acid aminotransferase [Methanosphaera cuniculi]PWL08827.1 branched-chain-amino-acid aminotransferase [Methanosphaera cuniculi]